MERKRGKREGRGRKNSGEEGGWIIENYSFDNAIKLLDQITGPNLSLDFSDR